MRRSHRTLALASAALLMIGVLGTLLAAGLLPIRLGRDARRPEARPPKDRPTAEAPAVAERPREPGLLAIVVGIDRYEEPSIACHGAASDARAVAEWLAAAGWR